MSHDCARGLEEVLMREICRDEKLELKLHPIGEQEIAGNVSEKLAWMCLALEF